MGQLTQTTSEVQSDLDRVWPKASGSGIKVDLDAPTFPWVDLIGLVLPSDDTPSTSPSLGEFYSGGPKAYYYTDGEELVCTYHIPHDWLPDSDAHIHLHWGHNGTAVSGSITVDAVVTYGDRDGTFVTPVSTASITHNMVDIATTPRYSHIVTEVPLFTETPTANEIDRSLVEVDGIIQVTFTVDGTPSVTGGNFFIFTGDIHHQSTGIGTKNNASPFYT